MRSIAGLTFSLAVLTASPALAKCRSVCHDNCARAVTGTGQGSVFTSKAKSDCSSFVVTTSYGHTITITADTATSGDKTIPTYASECSSPAGFASACSCFGITSHVVTKTDETTTVTVTSVSTSESSSSLSSSISSTESTSSTSSAETTSAAEPISSPSSAESTSSTESTTSDEPTSSTSSAAPEPTGCTEGLTSCGTTCLDLKSDPENCGGCGVKCDSGVCTNGACSLNSCTGQTCDTFSACGPGGSCVCASATGGTGFCADGQTPCAGLADCATSADCPVGSVCAVDTCCSRNVCIVADTCGGSTTPARLFRPRSASFASVGHRGGYVGIV